MDNNISILKLVYVFKKPNYYKKNTSTLIYYSMNAQCLINFFV